MEQIKTVARSVFVAVFFYVLFVYAGKFSMRQSIVLVAVILLLFRELSIASPLRRFNPYYVWVEPNWYQILFDFNLIHAPEEWQAMRKTFERLPADQCRVMRSGMFFTIISQSEPSAAPLVFWKDSQRFYSTVNFEAAMDCVAIQPDEHNGGSGTGEALFFMRAGVNGYDLGIDVPYWWWEKAKAACPKPIHENIDRATGRAELTLAVVPREEFDPYWESIKTGAKEYSIERMNQAEVDRERYLGQRGWKKVEEPDIPETRSQHRPEFIEHKYFSVRHDGV